MKKRILIIDDDIGYISIVQKNLTKEGFEISIAETKEKIKENLKSKKPDLILIDVLMNKQMGLKILKKLANENKDIRIIVISKAKEVNIIEKAFTNGAYDYIIKPFNVKDLINKILCALNTNKKSFHHV